MSLAYRSHRVVDLSSYQTIIFLGAGRGDHEETLVHTYHLRRTGETYLYSMRTAVMLS